MLGFYVPYVTTILLRYTYGNNFYGPPEDNGEWKFYEGQKHAIRAIYVF